MRSFIRSVFAVCACLSITELVQGQKGTDHLEAVWVNHLRLSIIALQKDRSLLLCNLQGNLKSQAKSKKTLATVAASFVMRGLSQIFLDAKSMISRRKLKLFEDVGMARMSQPQRSLMSVTGFGSAGWKP